MVQGGQRGSGGGDGKLEAGYNGGAEGSDGDQREGRWIIRGGEYIGMSEEREAHDLSVHGRRPTMFPGSTTHLLICFTGAACVPVHSTLQAFVCLARGADHSDLPLVQFNTLAYSLGGEELGEGGRNLAYKLEKRRVLTAFGAELEEIRLMGHTQRLGLEVCFK